MRRLMSVQWSAPSPGKFPAAPIRLRRVVVESRRGYSQRKAGRTVASNQTSVRVPADLNGRLLLLTGGSRQPRYRPQARATSHASARTVLRPGRRRVWLPGGTIRSRVARARDDLLNATTRDDLIG